MSEKAYKIMSEQEWSASLGAGRPYEAVIEADLRDGFLHCVSGTQVVSTLNMWYPDVEEVLHQRKGEGADRGVRAA